MTETVKIADNSREAVAFELMKYVVQNSDSETWSSKSEILKLYQDCVNATYRNFKG